jgi:hypothetical protein
MMTYLNTKASVFVTATIASSTGGSIGNNGINAMLPPNAFANSNGNPFNGTVTLKLQTITTIKDMIYSGVTTMASNDELIISDGMFKLEAYDSSNNKLKLRNGVTYSADFAAFNPSNKVFKGIDAKGNNKIEWDEWDEWDSTETKRGTSSTLVMRLDSLFKFCNLDRYMNETPLTDITITTPVGFTNVNTECFMKYTGENASAYLPANTSLKVFSTQGAFYKVVQGRAAKIICLAKKDGKFYYNIQTVAAITANQTLNITAMTETTETNLNIIIAGF